MSTPMPGAWYALMGYVGTPSHSCRLSVPGLVVSVVAVKQQHGVYVLKEIQDAEPHRACRSC